MLKSETKSETLNGASEMPALVTVNGIPVWQASGRTFPVVAGAEDPPPAGAKNDDPPKPQEGDGSGDDDFDKPRAMATIKQLRDREKAMKDQLKELDTLKAERKQREDAEKSEAERLRDEKAASDQKAADLQRELQDTRNRQAIERAAVKAGATDPDDVYALLKPADFDTTGEGGAITNAEKLVEALLKAKPYLAGKGTANGVPATPRSNGTQDHSTRVKENQDKLRASGDYPPL